MRFKAEARDHLGFALGWCLVLMALLVHVETPKRLARLPGRLHRATSSFRPRLQAWLERRSLAGSGAPVARVTVAEPFQATNCWCSLCRTHGPDCPLSGTTHKVVAGVVALARTADGADTTPSACRCPRMKPVPEPFRGSFTVSSDGPWSASSEPGLDPVSPEETGETAVFGPIRDPRFPAPITGTFVIQGPPFPGEWSFNVHVWGRGDLRPSPLNEQRQDRDEAPREPDQ